MRWVFSFWFALALSLALMAGCSEENGEGGSGGMAGTGGTGGTTGQEFACTEQGIRDAIAEGGGPHTFDCDGSTPVMTEAEIVIDNDVVLDGEGKLTVDGNQSHRVFLVEASTVELRRMTVTGGVAFCDEDLECPYGFESGGGVFSRGELLLTDVKIENNMAGEGGGICNISTGRLTLNNSTVTGNTAGRGGGILNVGEGATLRNSSVTGNAATKGGGINGDGLLTVINSTISGNSAESASAIFHTAGGEIKLISSTVSGAIHAKGYDDIVGGPSLISVLVASTLIEGACTKEDEVTLTSSGYNIEFPGNTCGFDPDGTDQVNVSADDLKLGELADNGGPTMTHALGAGSVAIDQIPAEDCVDADGQPLATDQRGEPRPETGGTMCDVGAFEVQP